jgi:hypothetical protein
MGSSTLALIRRSGLQNEQRSEGETGHEQGPVAEIKAE